MRETALRTTPTLYPKTLLRSLADGSNSAPELKSPKLILNQGCDFLSCRHPVVGALARELDILPEHYLGYLTVLEIPLETLIRGHD